MKLVKGKVKTEEKIRFIVKYGGHWTKRGWTYHEKKFESAKDAWECYQRAAGPKGIDVMWEDGFRASLSDKGMERYFNDFM